MYLVHISIMFLLLVPSLEFYLNYFLCSEQGPIFFCHELGIDHQVV